MRRENTENICSAQVRLEDITVKDGIEEIIVRSIVLKNIYSVCMDIRKRYIQGGRQREMEREKLRYCVLIFITLLDIPECYQHYF